MCFENPAPKRKIGHIEGLRIASIWRGYSGVHEDVP